MYRTFYKSVLGAVPCTVMGVTTEGARMGVCQSDSSKEQEPLMLNRRQMCLLSGVSG